ncbi:MAG: PAS domain-containing sensor histidine kinase [Arcticibacter sp.]
MDRISTVKYLISLILVLGAEYLKSLLLGSQEEGFSHLLFTGVIILSLRFLGKGPAIFALFVSALISFRGLMFKDGDPYWHTPHFLTWVLFLAENGLIIYIIDTYIRQTNEGLLKEKRFKTLIEESSEAFMLVGVNGSVRYHNPAVHRITGYTEEALRTISVWELIKEEDVTTLKEHFFKVASHAGSSITVQHRMKKADGTFIWAENAIANHLDNKSIQALVMNFKDITGRISHEQEMGDFLGIASHELKTPLTSLKAYTQVLEMRLKAENNSSSIQLVSKMDKQINRVIGMIFDLLDVTKLQSGIMYLKKENFMLNDLLTEMAENLGNVHTSHRIELMLDKNVSLHADRARLNQVLVNLVTNGIKYSPGGEKIILQTRVEDGRVTVSVRDFGIGISPLEIKNLFSRFYRVSSVRESFQGLGLGLYISNQIIEQHHGEMGVESEENQGSRFWFYLPLSAAEEQS